MPFCKLFCGYGSKTVEFPIQKTDVDVEIVGDFFAQVTIQQHFINKDIYNGWTWTVGRKQNVKYMFPLEESSAVCGFKATLGGGTVIEGIVKEKQQARREFNNAVRQGLKAGILDQEQADTFICEIGNLDADETCVVEIRYVTELKLENGSVKLVLPTSIAPRYKQKRGWLKYRNYPVIVSPGFGWNEDFSNNTNGAYPLSVNVSAGFSSKVLSISSPTHKIVSRRGNDHGDDGHATAKLVGPKSLTADKSCKVCDNGFIVGDFYMCTTCNNYRVCEGCLEGHAHEHALDLFEEKRDKGVERHSFIVCDNCNMYPLVGARYKCLTCEDFDLCEKCVNSSGQLHGHEFHRVYEFGLNSPIPITIKDKLARCAKDGARLKFLQYPPTRNYYNGFVCDNCDSLSICDVGLYHCAKCGNYDLCKKCYTKKSPFLKVKPLATSDIVFLFKQQSPFATRSLIGYSQKHQTTAVQVTFCRQPEDITKTADLPCELVFIADTSGSMSGLSMTNLKKAMHLFLRSLPTNCLFNLVEFNSRFSELFPKSEKISQRNLERASDFVDNWSARGGTEMLSPLNFVLGQAPREGHPKQVFILTDGAVHDADNIVQQVFRYAAATRVFTFGIGAGASRYLCKGVARAGNGTCEFLDSHEVTEKVMRTLDRALQPAYFGTKIDWSPLNARISGKFLQCPELIPPIYPGERYFVYALQQGGDALKKMDKSFDDTSLHGEFKCDDFRVVVSNDFQVQTSNNRRASLKQIDISQRTGEGGSNKMWLLDEGYFLDTKNSSDDKILWFLRYEFYGRDWKRAVTWTRIGKSKRCTTFERSLIPNFETFHLPILGKIPSPSHQEGEPSSELVRLSLEGHHNGTIIHCLAARAKIRELEKQNQTDDVKRTIISLGTEYNLTSKYTSFVAIQKTTSSSSSKAEVHPEEKIAELFTGVIEGENDMLNNVRCLPKSAPKAMRFGAGSSGGFSSGGFGSGSFGSGGFGSGSLDISSSSSGGFGSFKGGGFSSNAVNESYGFSGCTLGGGGGAQRHSARSRSRSRSPDSRRKRRKSSKSKSSKSKSSKSKSFSFLGTEKGERKSKEKGLPTAPDFDAIVKLQQFDGSWNLSENLTSMSGAVLLQKMKASGLFQRLPDEVFSTCLALVLLKAKYSSRRIEWQIIEMKAKRFVCGELKKIGVSENQLDQMIAFTL